MQTGYKVIDAMTRKVVAVSKDDDLKKCAELMAENHIGSILVIENSKLIGFLSAQDIVRRVVAKGINPIGHKVKEVMQANIVTIEPQADIYDALVKMKNKDVRHLPVVDAGKLLGIITLKDILKIQPRLFDFIVEKFHLKEESQKPVQITAREGNCDECGEFFEELNIIGSRLLCDRCKNVLEEDEE